VNIKGMEDAIDYARKNGAVDTTDIIIDTDGDLNSVFTEIALMEGASSGYVDSMIIQLVTISRLEGRRS
jgi:hypothetical protein